MSIKKLIKYIILILSFPIVYVAISSIEMLFVEKAKLNGENSIFIYHDLAHTEIILPVSKNHKLYQDKFPNLLKNKNYGYLAFSYGDRDFFMNVPTWEDINYKIALKSLFLNTPALIRVGHYGGIYKKMCVELKLNNKQLKNLNNSIMASFSTKNNHFIRYNDHYKDPNIFYFQAKKSYNIFYTCNSWTSKKLRDSGIISSYLTPLAYQVVYPFKKD